MRMPYRDSIGVIAAITRRIGASADVAADAAADVEAVYEKHNAFLVTS